MNRAEWDAGQEQEGHPPYLQLKYEPLWPRAAPNDNSSEHDHSAVCLELDFDM